MLVAPAQQWIPVGTHVVIVPDGALYGLNFETLIVPSPTRHYWIDDVTVTNTSSIALMSTSRPVAGLVPTASRSSSIKGRRLLLMGDPVSANNDFPALAQAGSEMARVEKYFAPADEEVFSGNRATPAAYLTTSPDQFSFIHFVAHGTASRASPLDSAVILSKQGDSYKLYARDIVKQPLHAELVTISACHGEGTRTYTGEGLVGLSWAFLRAGAHGVVAALWEVDDTSTPELMDHLYAGIRSGKDPATALRDAKLALLHSDTVYRKPFYWAPFQYYRGS
jgi:CHAT domain-containing protein